MDIFTRTVKRLYEKLYNQMSNGQRGIDSFLFGVDDFSTSANFALDQYIKKPHGVTFKKRGEETAIMPYSPGTGQVYEASEAGAFTPISAKLRDSVIAGKEATASFQENEIKLIEDILKMHTISHNTTRWKIALDTIRTGKFSPYGLKGEDIGLEIDFGRDASLEKTYDFTAVGAKITKALGELYDAYVAKNGARSNIVMILGKNWLSAFESDSDVQKQITANQSNILLEQNMMPPELNNTYGLYSVSRFRIPGRVSPVWICAYEPEGLFQAYSGASEIEYMPSDEAVIFSLGSSRFRAFRGVDVMNDNNQVIRAVGEIVFDSYTTPNPAGTFLRSNTRFAFIPGDVNNTARSTGTFAES